MLNLRACPRDDTFTGRKWGEKTKFCYSAWNWFYLLIQGLMKQRKSCFPHYIYQITNGSVEVARTEFFHHATFPRCRNALLLALENGDV